MWKPCICSNSLIYSLHYHRTSFSTFAGKSFHTKSESISNWPGRMPEMLVKLTMSTHLKRMRKNIFQESGSSFDPLLAPVLVAAIRYSHYSVNSIHPSTIISLAYHFQKTVLSSWLRAVRYSPTSYYPNLICRVIFFTGAPKFQHQKL